MTELNRSFFDVCSRICAKLDEREGKSPGSLGFQRVPLDDGSGPVGSDNFCVIGRDGERVIPSAPFSEWPLIPFKASSTEPSASIDASTMRSLRFLQARAIAHMAARMHIWGGADGAANPAVVLCVSDEPSGEASSPSSDAPAKKTALLPFVCESGKRQRLVHFALENSELPGLTLSVYDYDTLVRLSGERVVVIIRGSRIAWRKTPESKSSPAPNLLRDGGILGRLVEYLSSAPEAVESELDAAEESFTECFEDFGEGSTYIEAREERAGCIKTRFVEYEGPESFAACMLMMVRSVCGCDTDDDFLFNQKTAGLISSDTGDLRRHLDRVMGNISPMGRDASLCQSWMRACMALQYPVLGCVDSVVGRVVARVNASVLAQTEREAKSAMPDMDPRTSRPSIARLMKGAEVPGTKERVPRFSIHGAMCSKNTDGMKEILVKSLASPDFPSNQISAIASSCAASNDRVALRSKGLMERVFAKKPLYGGNNSPFYAAALSGMLDAHEREGNEVTQDPASRTLMLLLSSHVEQ